MAGQSKRGSGSGRGHGGNPFHDRRSGEFTSGPGGAGGGSAPAAAPAVYQNPWIIQPGSPAWIEGMKQLDKATAAPRVPDEPEHDR